MRLVINAHDSTHIWQSQSTRTFDFIAHFIKNIMPGLLLFFLLVLACEIIGTVGGFGSSVVFVPVMQFFFGFQTVLALTSILHVFSNMSKIILFYRHINLRFLLIYGIPSLIFAIVGAMMTARMSWAYNELALGLFLVIFSAAFLIFPKITFPASDLNAVTSGGVAGFLAGFIGTGGAVRGASMAAFNLEKNVFVATSGAIDFGVDFSRMIVYLQNGFLTPQYYGYLLGLFVASVAGTYLGKLVLDKIPQELFKKIVLIMVFVSGLMLIVQFIQK